MPSVSFLFGFEKLFCNKKRRSTPVMGVLRQKNRIKQLRSHQQPNSAKSSKKTVNTVYSIYLNLSILYIAKISRLQAAKENTVRNTSRYEKADTHFCECLLLSYQVQSEKSGRPFECITFGKSFQCCCRYTPRPAASHRIFRNAWARLPFPVVGVVAYSS